MFIHIMIYNQFHSKQNYVRDLGEGDGEGYKYLIKQTFGALLARQEEKKKDKRKAPETNTKLNCMTNLKISSNKLISSQA